MIRSPSIRFLLGLALLLAAAGPAAATRTGVPSPDAGLFYSETPVQPDAVRMRAAGPVLERVHRPSGRTYCALRPVVALAADPGEGASTTHVLWPLFTSQRRGNERSWNSLLIAWGRDADIRDPASRWSFILFPLVAAGRTAEGERYGGLFPIYGRLKEFAGKDEIDFVLFPIYSYTRQGDLNTWNVLWPIISWTRAEDEGRFRIFPFYGQSHEPGVRRRFILWPFWSEAHYSKPEHEGDSFLFFPFYGRIDLDNQQSWTVLYPFFRRSVAGEVTRLNAPWPFFRMRRGGGDDFTYVWPLYGHRRRPDLESRFVLWPLGGSETQPRDGGLRNRRWFVPFYFDERLVVKGAEPEVPARRVRIWPLATYERDRETLRFHTLELWPAAPVDAVERLYAPFWTLYSHERVGRDVADEVLWGLFRRVRGEGYAHTSVFPLVSWGGSEDNASSHWEVLKGFFGYEREGDERRMRILYFRIGK